MLSSLAAEGSSLSSSAKNMSLLRDTCAPAWDSLRSPLKLHFKGDGAPLKKCGTDPLCKAQLNTPLVILAIFLEICAQGLGTGKGGGIFLEILHGLENADLHLVIFCIQC